ncbi:MAG: 5-bromo-4-chloroindolyl phosphate hydrolysis family protein [Phycisphaerales bacterium]|nr:5-bromo-4-chloroindolyl phosphate hydrolysis family protein [Phycisphaerales bacterium]
MGARPQQIDKTRKERPAVNIEIASGVISAGGVVLAYLVFGAPLWLCLALGLGLYLGIAFLGSSRLDKRIRVEARQLAPPEMESRLVADQEKLARIRELCRDLEDEEIRLKILTICGLAEGIFNNLLEGRIGGPHLGRFFLYLERTIQVVERYSQLSADQLGRELLQKERSEFIRLLDQAQEAFNKGYRNLLNDRIVEFKTMSRVLGRMMEIAEIGP